MHDRLPVVPPPVNGVFRLARGPADPFSPPDWGLAHDDGTFGNRFDDPGTSPDFSVTQRFGVIYCATQRAASLGETVARFRPSLRLLALLATVEDDEPLQESLEGGVDPDYPKHGLIPADWRLKRRIGQTMLDPSLRFVDIANPETMQFLRPELASVANRLGVTDIDLSSLTSQQRQFTQHCARYVYEQVGADGAPCYAGIRYPSRLNAEWECWAVFADRIRHAPGWPGFPNSMFPDDADLLNVARMFRLTIEVFPGHEQFMRPWRS